LKILWPSGHYAQQSCGSALSEEDGYSIFAPRFFSQAAAWGENPLLLSLAAVVFVKIGGLPTSRASLYHEVVEAVLVFKEPDDSIARRHLFRTLTAFSLWLYQEKKVRTFTLDDLLVFLEDIQKRPWDDAETIAKKVTRSGILDIVAHETYGFRHQTFQEYLAAAELAQQLIGQTQKKEGSQRFCLE
jgi:predicted NACHT family NTPase